MFIEVMMKHIGASFLLTQGVHVQFVVPRRVVNIQFTGTVRRVVQRTHNRSVAKMIKSQLFCIQNRKSFQVK